VDILVLAGMINLVIITLLREGILNDVMVDCQAFFSAGSISII
jgi:hypothetical protein